METFFFKIRHLLKGKQEIAPSLCVFNIDDPDVEELKIKPYNRDIFSRLIKILHESQVRTALFDYFFQEEIDSEADSKLVGMSREAGFVFYPLFLNNSTPSAKPETELLRKVLFTPRILKSGSPVNTDFFHLPFPELSKAAAGLGTIHLQPENDAITHRLPLVFSYKNSNEFIPALPLIVLCHYLDFNLHEAEISFGEHIRLRCDPEKGKKDLLIPIDNQGRMIINYSGPWNDSIDNYSMRDIFYLYENSPHTLKDLISDSLVIASDISSGKKDYSRGIFETYYPNSGIISNALNTILTEEYLYEPGLLFSILSSLFFILLIWVSASRLNLYQFTIVVISALLFYLIITSLLFIYFNRLPEISLQLCGVLLSYLGIVIFKGNTKTVINPSSLGLEKADKEIKTMEVPVEIPFLEINEKACRDFEITPAQRKLLKVLQKGYTYKKTADILGITESTVKKQISRIKETTGIYQKKDILELFFPLT